MKAIKIHISPVVILIGCLLISAVSCKKIDELLTFEIDDSSTITVTSATPLNLPVNIPSPAVATNSSGVFQNNNTSADHVKDIKLKSLQLTITNPSGKTFSFLQSVHVYISTGSASEIELASADNIASTSNTLTLTPTQAKLDAYLKGATYNLRAAVVTKEVLTQAVDIRIDSKFSVTATL